MTAWKYSHAADVLIQVIRADIKARYRRSFLGSTWLYLSPLLTSMVMIAAFAGIFRPSGFSLLEYAIYVLSGVVFLQFVTGGVTGVTASLTNSAGLITRIRVPRLLFPAAALGASSLTLIIGVSYVILLSAWTGRAPNYLLPIALIGLMSLCLAAGLILSLLQVRVADTSLILPVALQALMYITPVFYPQSIWPEEVAPYLEANPLVTLMAMFREGLGIATDNQVGFSGLLVTGMCLVALALSWSVFRSMWLKSVARL